MATQTERKTTSDVLPPSHLTSRLSTLTDAALLITIVVVAILSIKGGPSTYLAAGLLLGSAVLLGVKHLYELHQRHAHDPLAAFSSWKVRFLEIALLTLPLLVGGVLGCAHVVNIQTMGWLALSAFLARGVLQSGVWIRSVLALRPHALIERLKADGTFSESIAGLEGNESRDKAYEHILTYVCTTLMRKDYLRIQAVRVMKEGVDKAESSYEKMTALVDGYTKDKAVLPAAIHRLLNEHPSFRAILLSVSLAYERTPKFLVNYVRTLVEG